MARVTRNEKLKILRDEAKKLGYTFKQCGSTFNGVEMWAMYSRTTGWCNSVKAGLDAWYDAYNYGVIKENTGNVGMGYGINFLAGY